MAIQVSTKDTIDVSLPSDTEEPRTVFTIKVPTLQEKHDLEKKVMSLGDGDTAEATKASSEIMKHSLSTAVIGWENVTDEEGNDVKFSREALLSALTISQRAELFFEVQIAWRILSPKDRPSINTDLGN